MSPVIHSCCSLELTLAARYRGRARGGGDVLVPSLYQYLYGRAITMSCPRLCNHESISVDDQV